LAGAPQLTLNIQALRIAAKPDREFLNFIEIEEKTLSKLRPLGTMPAAGLCCAAVMLLMLASPARASFTYDTPDSTNGTATLSATDATDNEPALSGWSETTDAVTPTDFSDDNAVISDDSTTSDTTSDPALGSNAGGTPITTDAGAPEPATCGLIGLGLLGIPLARKLLNKRIN
jgi:hypothetical protein